MQIEGSNVPAHYGIRTQRYKLIYFYGLGLDMNGSTEGWTTPPGWELYDLQEDPLELMNLYGIPEYEQIIRDLKKELYQPDRTLVK